MGALKGKVALITGASSGIGMAAARLFAQEGASLVLAARRKERLDALVDEIESEGGSATALAGNVVDEAYANALVEQAMLEFGGLDIAFNNAGVLGDIVPTPSVSQQQWRDVLDTNLMAAFLGAKYQLPAMLSRGAGSLIFTSSFVGYTVGMPEMAAYSASKAGLIGLSKSLAAEYGAKNIRVNALLPGGTFTEMSEAFTSAEESLAFLQGMHALKRLAQPEEVAKSALYLASEASGFTTGSALFVDGGASICRT